MNHCCKRERERERREREREREREEYHNQEVKIKNVWERERERVGGESKRVREREKVDTNLRAEEGSFGRRRRALTLWAGEWFVAIHVLITLTHSTHQVSLTHRTDTVVGNLHGENYKKIIPLLY